MNSSRIQCSWGESMKVEEDSDDGLRNAGSKSSQLGYPASSPLIGSWEVPGNGSSGCFCWERPWWDPNFKQALLGCLGKWTSGWKHIFLWRQPVLRTDGFSFQCYLIYSEFLKLATQQDSPPNFIVKSGRTRGDKPRGSVVPSQRWRTPRCIHSPNYPQDLSSYLSAAVKIPCHEPSPGMISPILLLQWDVIPCTHFLF